MPLGISDCNSNLSSLINWQVMVVQSDSKKVAQGKSTWCRRCWKDTLFINADHQWFRSMSFLPFLWACNVLHMNSINYCAIILHYAVLISESVVNQFTHPILWLTECWVRLLYFRKHNCILVYCRVVFKAHAGYQTFSSGLFNYTLFNANFWKICQDILHCW